MLKSTFSCLVLLFLGTGCTWLSSPGTTKVVYQVNDSQLTAGQFAERLAARLKNYDALQVKDPEVLKSVKGQILQEFLSQQLVSDWAKKNNIAVSGRELDAAVDKYRKQYPNDLAMKESLAESGQSFNEWRDSLVPILLQEKVFDVLKAKMVEPSDEELLSYFEANKDQFRKPAMIKVRQIVLGTKDDAERMIGAISKTSSLAELAKKFSIAPEAKNGGETDWIPKGSVDIFDAAFAWPIGKRSPVLKSPYGYHIFEVIAKQPETQLSFIQAKDSIRGLMRADREQAAFYAWQEEQIKAARVFRNDSLINSVKIETRGGT